MSESCISVTARTILNLRHAQLNLDLCYSVTSCQQKHAFTSLEQSYQHEGSVVTLMLHHRGQLQSYLSLGVCMSSMRQGLLAATAALASDLKASFTTLITCRYSQA